MHLWECGRSVRPTSDLSGGQATPRPSRNLHFGLCHKPQRESVIAATVHEDLPLSRQFAE